MLFPAASETVVEYVSQSKGEFFSVIWNLTESMLWTIGEIIVLINLLLILQAILEEFSLIKLLEKPLSPLMKIFGLSRNSSFLWLVGNTIGLAYGSAVMIAQVEKGKLSNRESDLLNHHLAISHSQLENIRYFFYLIGYNAILLIIPRIILAIIMVWLRRFELWLRNRYKFTNLLFNFSKK